MKCGNKECDSHNQNMPRNCEASNKLNLNEECGSWCPQAEQATASCLSDLLACTLQFIPVDDHLPLQDLDHKDKPNVIGRYLCWVELDDADISDGKQLAFVEFHGDDDRWWADGVPYNWGWHVTHWAELPEPPK